VINEINVTDDVIVAMVSGVTARHDTTKKQDQRNFRFVWDAEG